MGSIISHIYDEYDTYEAMCKCLGIEPVDIRDINPTFFDEMSRILKEHDCESEYEFFNKMKELGKL